MSNTKQRTPEGVLAAIEAHPRTQEPPQGEVTYFFAAHSGPGFYFSDLGYLSEGSDGAYPTRWAARNAAEACGYVVHMNIPANAPDDGPDPDAQVRLAREMLARAGST